MRVTTIALAGAMIVGAAHASPPPWARTETRAPCAAYDADRVPFFGDTHVHTTLSFDAVSGDLRATPREAYEFALGAPLGLPPYDAFGVPQRTVQIDRPLDFAIVTDHSEFFGEVRTCLTAGLPGYDAIQCQNFRNAIPQPGQVASAGIQAFAINYLVPFTPQRFAFCGAGAADCLAQASLVWQEVRNAAEEFYDRTAACGFTTFVGYEWTGNTGVQNLHRNVIFRNDDVPALPTSYVEEPTAQGLWAALESQCLGGLARCDVLAIPHNSNISNGTMFAPQNADGSPLTATDATVRAAMEPVVEITQHKGDSECRPGVTTTDELCGFEKWNGIQIGIPAPPPTTPIPPLLFVRNALKEGLVQEEALGVNPFRLGVIGSTDTHNATSGLVREDDYVGAGHLGTRDATPALMMYPLALGVTGGVESNPGGLAVIWAEENSRDALFAALRRREVYGTSGPRPIVRFFGGRGTGVVCGAGDFAGRAYESGVPMGGELGAVLGERSPRFAVLALKDPGPAGFPGTPLQRIQIVKGWVDANGQAQEKVFEVAGDPDNGATVDEATCVPSGSGFDSLCAVWEDPEFDHDRRAFYYARVVENPVCRWSTRLCNAAGVDCAVPATIPPGLAKCCDPTYPPTIQERAWTSPIWYRPEAIRAVRGRLTFGRSPGRDVLRATMRIGRVPATVDPASADLTIRFADDDAFYAVTIPAGTLVQDTPSRYRYSDPSGSLGGLRRASFTIRANGEGALRLRTVPTDLAAADRTAHFIVVTLTSGTYATEYTRRWDAAPRGLRLRH